MSADPSKLSLLEAAAAFRGGKVSAQALAEASLARIEAWQPKINAFIKIEKEAALKAAKAADRARKRGAKLGPLAGIPLAHKDMFYRQGHETSCGSAIRRHWKAPVTATVLQRLDTAGAFELGRLNMAEFAFNPTGHNYHYGHARNPWNPAKITGGSSSGSAAAVAARLVYAALGSDTGGSIREPAHFCGLVGMKPTWGRVSRFGCMPLSFSLDTIGPLTRRVADNAFLLKLLAGADPLDPTAAAEPVPDYVAAARPGSLRGMKIAVPRIFFWDKMQKASAQCLEEAIALFSKMGAKIIEMTPPDMDAVTAAANIVVSSEAAAAHGPWLKTRPHLYSPALRARLENGLALSAVDYVDALRWRGTAIAEWLRASQDADAVLTPVVHSAAPGVEETDLAGKPEAAKLIASLTRLVRPINYLGLPGLTVPAGIIRGGLPIGMQLIGRPFGETALYRLAGAFEARKPVYLESVD